jgi:hypothetical protein
MSGWVVNAGQSFVGQSSPVRGVSVKTSTTAINVNTQSDHSSLVDIVHLILRAGAVTRRSSGCARCMPSAILAD